MNGFFKSSLIKQMLRKIKQNAKIAATVINETNLDFHFLTRY